MASRPPNPGWWSLSATDAPDVLSVEEAAAVLGISRGKAYEWARRYLETNGSEGMPVVAFGRCFRVPRAGLEQMLGGELHWTREPKEAPTVAAPPVPPESPRPASSSRPRRRRPANDAQLNLFDPLAPVAPEQHR